VSEIELSEPLALAPVAARDAVFAIVREISERRAPYDRVALSLGLQKVRLPVDATVTVPIDVTAEATPLRWECTIHIEAQSRRGLFPRFDGTLGVAGDSRDQSRLSLQGNYDAPFGALGRGGDAILMHGAATESLRSFLKWLAAETTRTVESRERDRLRQSRLHD